MVFPAYVPSGARDASPVLRGALDLGGDIRVPAGAYLLGVTLRVHPDTRTIAVPGAVFRLTKRGRAMASSLYLSESVCLSDGVDALLGARAQFGRSTGSPTLTVTATGHDTAFLQHLFKHGFLTARAMVRMLSRPPLVSTSSALCTPLASETG